MRRIITCLPFFFLFFFLLLNFFHPKAFASYQITADREDVTQPTTKEARSYLCGDVFSSCLDVVTENTQTLHIKFTGLKNNGKYVACISTGCLVFTSSEKLDFGVLAALDDVHSAKNLTSDGTGNLTLDLCAAGEDDLKVAAGGECDPKDFFWGRHVYAVVLFDADSTSSDGKFPPVVDSAAFYVSNYYPEVIVAPNRLTPSDPIKVTIKGTRRPRGDPYKGFVKNNYTVEIAKANNPSQIYSQDCVYVPDTKDGTSVDLDPREEGDYIIKINEQIKDTGLNLGNCEAGFTYYWIKIKVRSSSFWKTALDAAVTNKSTNIVQSLIEIIPDPNGTDIPGANKGRKVPPPPCTTNNFRDVNGACPEVKTGLGMNIKTEPGEFVGSVFSLILGLAGGIALLLIISSGLQMMTSQGKPEKLEAAREQLVSAIIGLLFIIFAFVILQIIGFDILRIPDFKQ